MTANELAEIADGLSCEIPIREWIDNEPKNVMNDIATMLRKQQAEIEKLGSELDRIVELYTDKAIENEALKEELKLYADAIGEERGNKALRNNEIGKILTKVLDDCGLLKKASEK